MSKATGIKGYTPDRLRRKEDAEQRARVYEQRTPAEQLALLLDRPGRSARETARLSA